jgi:hypothetical protein
MFNLERQIDYLKAFLPAQIFSAGQKYLLVEVISIFEGTETVLCYVYDVYTHHGLIYEVIKS